MDDALRSYCLSLSFWFVVLAAAVPSRAAMISAASSCGIYSLIPDELVRQSSGQGGCSASFVDLVDRYGPVMASVEFSGGLGMGHGSIDFAAITAITGVGASGWHSSQYTGVLGTGGASRLGILVIEMRLSGASNGGGVHGTYTVGPYAATFEGGGPGFDTSPGNDDWYCQGDCPNVFDPNGGNLVVLLAPFQMGSTFPFSFSYSGGGGSLTGGGVFAASSLSFRFLELNGESAPLYLYRDPSPIPEPGTLGLLALPTILLAVRARRRRR